MPRLQVCGEFIGIAWILWIESIEAGESAPLSFAPNKGRVSESTG